MPPHRLVRHAPRRRPGLVAALLALAGVAACGDDPTSPPRCWADVNAHPRITATAGTTPTISWTPSCRVGEMRVVDIDQGAPVWIIRSRVRRNGAPANELTPGIRYGKAPRGATATVAPVPLVSGRQYVVTLTTYARQSDGTIFPVTGRPLVLHP